MGVQMCSGECVFVQDFNSVGMMRCNDELLKQCQVWIKTLMFSFNPCEVKLVFKEPSSIPYNFDLISSSLPFKFGCCVMIGLVTAKNAIPCDLVENVAFDPTWKNAKSPAVR
jgi:hypothetical protein